MKMSRPSLVGRGVAFALLACLLGCQGEAAPRPSPEKATSTAQSPSARKAAPPPRQTKWAAAEPIPSPAERPSLGERLAVEAAARPPGAIKLEALVAALGGRGLVLTRMRQVLASPLGGRYCAIAVTEEGLGISVCEFDSSGAAFAAQAQSKELFDRLVPDRQLHVNGQSLLTLSQIGPTLHNQSQTVAAMFAAMHAE